MNKFGGVNLSTTNLKRTVHFYKDLLKIPTLEYNENNLDGTKFGFHESDPGIWIWDENRWGKASTGSVNLVFYTADLQQLYEELKNNEVECDPPFVADWGGMEFKVFDPDGNQLTILKL